MNLTYADKCAAKLIEWLGPFSKRIEIAGSVRRRCAECGDLDVVIVPQVRVSKDLFGRADKTTNLLLDEVRHRIKADGWESLADGDEICRFRAKGVQTDLYFTTEAAWGSVLLQRTGSAQHNIWLAQKAMQAGGKWVPNHGLYLMQKCFGRTEEEIYTALGLPCIPPAERSL